MRLTHARRRLTVEGIMVLLYLVALPLWCAAVTRETSAELTELLWDARDEAVQLASDADQMQMLLLSDSNWLTHDLMLHKIKGHVDDMALIVRKLNETQKSGSDVQQQAVEQMLPLVRELSENTTAAIHDLDQNKNRPPSDTYRQYLKKNAETARELSSMVSSLVDYEESMADIAQLRRKLASE
jgi:hypothetical protein